MTGDPEPKEAVKALLAECPKFSRDLVQFDEIGSPLGAVRQAANVCQIAMLIVEAPEGGGHREMSKIGSKPINPGEEDHESFAKLPISTITGIGSCRRKKWNLSVI